MRQPLLVSHQNEKYSLHKDNNFNLAVLYLIGNIIGSFASGWISDSFGRKSTLLWSGLPLALSWLAIGLSANSAMLYGSSFSQGMSTAVPYTSAGILRFEAIIIL